MGVGVAVGVGLCILYENIVYTLVVAQKMLDLNSF